MASSRTRPRHEAEIDEQAATNRAKEGHDDGDRHFFINNSITISNPVEA